MHDEVYFTETKPGVFEKNSKLKLKPTGRQTQ